MSRYNRLSSNFSFVFLVLIIVLCASWLWQTETRSTQLDYSQVRQLFIQEKVERFTIDSNYTLTMTLREARDDSILVDVSHLNDRGFNDLLKTASRPFATVCLTSSCSTTT